MAMQQIYIYIYIFFFFPKKSLITVFDKESIAQNNSVKSAFQGFIIKPKCNSSKNMSIKLKPNKNRRNSKFYILPPFLLVRTHNSNYKNYSFEAWKLLVPCCHVKSFFKVRKLGKQKKDKNMSKINV